MGMTVEKAHRILSNGLANAPSEHEWCMAFKLAINTMRKYQKIERYMEKLEKNGQYGTLRKLKIVLGEAE